MYYCVLAGLAQCVVVLAGFAQSVIDLSIVCWPVYPSVFLCFGIF